MQKRVGSHTKKVACHVSFLRSRPLSLLPQKPWAHPNNGWANLIVRFPGFDELWQQPLVIEIAADNPLQDREKTNQLCFCNSRARLAFFVWMQKRYCPLLHCGFTLDNATEG